SQRILRRHRARLRGADCSTREFHPPTPNRRRATGRANSPPPSLRQASWPGRRGLRSRAQHVMTTLIFIENVLGSGQVVKLTEDFGDYSVTRDLRPGEHARLVISPFKTLSVEEVALS